MGVFRTAYGSVFSSLAHFLAKGKTSPTSLHFPHMSTGCLTSGGLAVTVAAQVIIIPYYMCSGNVWPSSPIKCTMSQVGQQSLALHSQNADDLTELRRFHEVVTQLTYRGMTMP